MSKRKLNCWEVLKCGRESGGDNVDEFDVCPAAAAELLDGVHGGCNGGRCCWAIAGTACHGRVQGTFAEKLRACEVCRFYIQVLDEQGWDMDSVGEILRKLKDAEESSQED